MSHDPIDRLQAHDRRRDPGPEARERIRARLQEEWSAAAPAKAPTGPTTPASPLATDDAIDGKVVELELRRPEGRPRSSRYRPLLAAAAAVIILIGLVGLMALDDDSPEEDLVAVGINLSHPEITAHCRENVATVAQATDEWKASFGDSSEARVLVQALEVAAQDLDNRVPSLPDELGELTAEQARSLLELAAQARLALARSTTDDGAAELLAALDAYIGALGLLSEVPSCATEPIRVARR